VIATSPTACLILHPLLEHIVEVDLASLEDRVLTA